jgi:hypothetical protein
VEGIEDLPIGARDSMGCLLWIMICSAYQS